MEQVSTEEYLKPADIATLLGHSDPEPVYRLIRSGALTARDVSLNAGSGRARYIVLRSDWLAFLDRRRVVPAPKPAQRRRERRVAEGVPQVYL